MVRGKGLELELGLGLGLGLGPGNGLAFFSSFIFCLFLVFRFVMHGLNNYNEVQFCKITRRHVSLQDIL